MANKVRHETCQQYVARRLSEGWEIIEQKGFNVILQSPEGILRPVNLRNDVETLRPNATGSETSIAAQYPSSTSHWDKVDEVVADDADTDVHTDNASYQRDLYNLPASSGEGTINFIKIYMNCYCNGTSGQGRAKPSLKSNSTTTDGSEVVLEKAWLPYSQQWNTNPADSQAWEWADIDALQIGVSLHGDGAYTARCTQVYVEVDYVGISAPTVTTQAVSDIGLD